MPGFCYPAQATPSIATLFTVWWLTHMVQVMDTLAEINERHEAVKELEKSLMELHQVFLDMAVLVEAQGEMLDNIEQQVAARPLAMLVCADFPN